MTAKKRVGRYCRGMGPLATIELMKLIMEETPATTIKNIYHFWYTATPGAG